MPLRNWLSDLLGILYVWVNGAQSPQSNGLEFLGTGITAAYDPITGRNKVTFAAAGGAAIGPGSSIDGTPALWDGTSGQLLKDGPINLAGGGTFVTGSLPLGNVGEETINVLTGSSNTLAIGANKKFTTVSHTSTTTLTVPTNASVAFPVGTFLPLMQAGVGNLVIAAAGGVTVRVASLHTLAASEQYAVLGLKKLGTDEWVLFGNLGLV